MANTLTGLIPVLYRSLDTVCRELVGFIPAVAKNSSAQMAAKDQTIRIPVVPAASASADWSPAQTAPNTGDITLGYKDMTIAYAKTQPVRVTGEDQLTLDSGNEKMYEKFMGDRFEQAIRMLINEMELVVATKAYKGASRAYGTAGTNPFATDCATPTAQLRKILDDNGCPPMDRQLVINTAAAAAYRSYSGNVAVYAAGTDKVLRSGALLPINDFALRESAQVVAHTKGTATGFDCTAIEPVGETTIAADGSNSGTVLAGDVVTRGVEGGSSADANKYVVNSGSTLTGAASGNFIINNPGLLLATAVADEWTIGGSYAANVGFQRNAIQLITRALAVPIGGDGAKDRIVITDPMTGLSFTVALYGEYGQLHYSIGIAYGAEAIKSNNIAILLG
jgi:hypothetical protein